MSSTPRRDGTEVASWVLDLLLGAGVSLAIALIIATDRGGQRTPDLGAYAFAVGFGALMLLRRRLPRTMLVAAVVAMFGYYTLDYPPIGVVVPVAAVLYATADAGRTWWAIGAGIVVLTVSTYFRLRDGESWGYLAGYEGMSNLALVITAIALGYSTHTRRVSVAHQAEITRLTLAHAAHTAEVVQRAERERLSRDLHDTVGHAMSIITVHAGVADEAIGRDDAAASAAIARVRGVATSSLRDVRAMVRLLRDPAARPGLGPDPAAEVVSVAGLPDLVEAARATGLEVACRLRVRSEELPAAVDAAAYRIVQESLTNIVRHSGARTADVTAELPDDHLLLTISDDGAAAAQQTGGGHGIDGMRERARLLGGTLVAGPVDGGFRVEARLPARLGP